MVDTRDLKSLGQKCPCGFDSRLRHKWDDEFVIPFVFLPQAPTRAATTDYFRKTKNTARTRQKKAAI